MKSVIDLYKLYLKFACKKNVDMARAKVDNNLAIEFCVKNRIASRKDCQILLSKNHADSVFDFLDCLQK